MICVWCPYKSRWIKSSLVCPLMRSETRKTWTPGTLSISLTLYYIVLIIHDCDQYIDVQNDPQDDNLNCCPFGTTGTSWIKNVCHLLWRHKGSKMFIWWFVSASFGPSLPCGGPGSLPLKSPAGLHWHAYLSAGLERTLWNNSTWCTGTVQSHNTKWRTHRCINIGRHFGQFTHDDVNAISQATNPTYDYSV